MKKTNRLRIGVITCLWYVIMVWMSFSSLAWASNGVVKFVDGELLVQPKTGVSDAEVDRILRSHGAKKGKEIGQIRVKQIKVPAQALEQVKAALSKNPNFSFVEYNYIADGAYEPNDERYTSQWHLPMISAPDAWDMAIGSPGATIAIIDSGVDPDHPDLSEKLVQGYNFLEGNTDTHDVQGHGTKVAGAAAAMTNNAEGVAGVAWDSTIMPLVVLNADNWASYSDIAQAITYAADRGVRIMNISIGGTSSSSTLQTAINYGWNKGAVVFACAHNYATDTPYYPAACDHVIAVSATTSGDTLASWSNYGNWIDVSAPGSSIMTTLNGGSYGYSSGTSFASPIVAGVASLVLAVNPLLTNDQIVDLLVQNSDDLGTSGFDPYYGYGRVNAFASVSAAMDNSGGPPEDMFLPDVSMVSPLDGAEVSGSITISVDAVDNVGVERVEVYMNGELFGTSFTEPHTFCWNTEQSSDGAYDIGATAFDSSGNQSTFDYVTVEVRNSVPADTQAPQVTMLEPTDGSEVSGLITISVEAVDDVEIDRVEVYVNGELFGTRFAQPYDFSWNTELDSDGTYDIAATAFDNSNNQSAYDYVTVQVNNAAEVEPPVVLPPYILLLGADDGAVIDKIAKLLVEASADTGISKVELYINGVLEAETTSATMRYVWNARKEAPGAYTFLAKAYDNAGNTGTDSITLYR